jgi:hypothetical protein
LVTSTIRQVSADQQQREGAEGDRPRRAELHPRPGGVHPEREQHRHDAREQPAQIADQSVALPRQIGDGAEVQIIGKDPRQPDTASAAPAADRLAAPA